MDPWEAFYNILLVLIPSLIGLSTTKWVTSNWQTRKETIEIRKNIQNEFDESIGKLMLLLIGLNRKIWTHYTKVNNQTISKNGKLYNLDTVFPPEPNEFPAIKFADEIQQFDNEFQAEVSFWKFETSIVLHYKDSKSLQKDLIPIITKIPDARIELLKFVNSKNEGEFDQYHETFNTQMNELFTLVRNLTLKLLTSEIKK